MIYNLASPIKDSGGTYETWVIAEDPPLDGASGSFTINANFSSNGEDFTEFYAAYD